MMRFLAAALILLTSHVALAADAAAPRVKFETTLGDFIIELDAAKAPITVKNFLDYVDSGYYDGTIFHRVIKGFVIQGGGFTAGLQRKPAQAPIKNEADNGLKNLRGTLSMARTNIVDSATSQFFVNTVDNPNLDHKGPQAYGYAVFGKVVEGMDVIDKIEAQPTGRMQGMQDVPLSSVTVKKASRI